MPNRNPALPMSLALLFVAMLFAGPSYAKDFSATGTGVPYGTSGYWSSFTVSSVCDEAVRPVPDPGSSRVCAEWLDDGFPEFSVYCCIERSSMFGNDFDDCLFRVILDQRDPRGGTGG